MHTQRRGAYAALGLGGAFVAMIAYFVIFGGRPQAQVKGPEMLPQPRQGSRAPLAAINPDGAIDSGDGLRIDLVDKQDPNRRAGQLILAKLDPLEGKRYAVDKPEAWMYLTDGRSVYVRADSGNLYMPGSKQQPESGTISGHVEIQLFAARADGKLPDRNMDKPTTTILTENLAFEAAVGEVATPGLVTVLFEQGKFEGMDVTLVFNQVLARLERADVRRGGKFWVYTQQNASPKSPPQSAPTLEQAPATEVAANPSQAPVTPAAPVKGPVETLYRLVVNEKVTVTQLQRRLDADKLEVWARLLDNQLPKGAIADVKFASNGDAPAAAAPLNTTQDAAPPSSSPLPASSATSVAQAPKADLEEAATTSSSDMVLAWTGPCVIVPLAATPEELKGNHMALRFTAEKTGRVNVADAERGISGFASSITYAATMRAMSLIGSAGIADSGVQLDVPGSGRLNAVRLDADLAHGIVRTPSAGTLRAGKDEDSKQDLTWGDKGEFAFWMKNGELTNALKSATVSGDVRGSGKGLSFKSKEAHAEFAEAPGSAKQLVVTRTILSGDAIADSADTGHMQGGKIDVSFDPPVNGASGAEGEPRARVVIAEKDVVVNRQGQRLASQFLESHLIDVENGKVDVGSVVARGGVEFASEKDFLVGKTEELSADLGFDENGKRKQLVNLIGSDSSITRNRPGFETGTIAAAQMQIDGLRGRLDAFGVGDFAYTGPNKDETANLDAKWTKRMVYDDLGGLIDCLGDAVIHYSPDALTKNRAEGERVKLMMTPGVPGQSVFATTAGDAKPVDPSHQNREVFRAEAYGSILDRDGGVNAGIESRMYAAGAAGDDRELAKLYYLEGPTILADNKAGTMDVPGAGKFLLMDQSAVQATPSLAPGTRDLGGGGDSRGVSLFAWSDSLHVEKFAGGEMTMLMKDGVSVVHRALKDDVVTEIKCAAMTAHLKDQGGSLGGPSGGMELQNVEASGGVYSASGPPKTVEQPRPAVRELIAQRLNYDAVKRRIVAEADKGGVVTLFDPAAASPTTASWLSWDLATDSIEVKNPSGVAPR